MEFERTYFSNAKINLGLTIPFRYPSGFHHIVSIFVPIDLSDEMSIGIQRSPDQNFAMTWENQLPAMFDQEKTALVFTQNYKSNLIFKATEWMIHFLHESGINLPNLDIRVHIKKKIPSPAGLGGGSSNAAVILQAFLDFLKTDPLLNSAIRWNDLISSLQRESLKLGSDIPFFISHLSDSAAGALQPALISGTGEVFEKLPAMPIAGIIGIPQFGFSTKEMFQSLHKPVYQGERENMVIFKKNTADDESGLPNDKKLFSMKNNVVLLENLPHKPGKNLLLYCMKNFFGFFKKPRQSATPINLTSNLKKSLHDDNSNIFNLNIIHQKFKDFYELCMHNKVFEANHGNMGITLQEILCMENDRNYFLNNDFIRMAEKLFPDKYIVIDKIRKTAVEEVFQSAMKDNITGNLVSSMSGSGTAIYAGWIGNNGLESGFQRNLESSVTRLRKEFPDVFWMKFCSI